METEGLVGALIVRKAAVSHVANLPEFSDKHVSNRGFGRQCRTIVKLYIALALIGRFAPSSETLCSSLDPVKYILDTIDELFNATFLTDTVESTIEKDIGQWFSSDAAVMLAKILF